MKFARSFLVVLLSVTGFAAQADTLEPLPAPKAYFVNLKDGDRVKNPIKVKFGIEGMAVAPAETYKPNTGHFHLLIDTVLTPEEMEYAIPNDEKHLHFGKAQTETDITLTPGKHTLQIVMGDGAHALHKPPVMSPLVTIVVE